MRKHINTGHSYNTMVRFTESPGDTKVFQCKQCTQSSTTKGGINRHINSKHGRIEAEPAAKMIKNKSKVVQLRDPCKACGSLGHRQLGFMAELSTKVSF